MTSTLYGPPAVRHRQVHREGPLYPDAEIVELTTSASPALATRLGLPRVLLVGLGDRDRYRGARLPLGVARLASWLRFSHAALAVGNLARVGDVRVHRLTAHWVTVGEPHRYAHALTRWHRLPRQGPAVPQG